MGKGSAKAAHTIAEARPSPQTGLLTISRKRQLGTAGCGTPRVSPSAYARDGPIILTIPAHAKEAQSGGASPVLLGRRLAVAAASKKIAHGHLMQCDKECGVCKLAFFDEAEATACRFTLTRRLEHLESKEAALLAASRAHGQERSSSAISQQYAREGVLIALRQLKAAVLTNRRCPACRKRFDSIYQGELLSRLDRASAFVKARQPSTP